MGAIGLLLDELERVGGRIVFIAEGLDSSQPGARHIIGLLAEQARAESNSMSWRAAQSREASRRLGRWASKRPYGYAGSSLRAISRGLNADGVPSPRRAQVDDARAEGRHTKGARGSLAWGVPTIRKMLVSPVLAGLQTHHGDIVCDDRGQPITVGEGIIDLAEHGRVLAEMERRKSAVQRVQDATGVGGGRPKKYLLSGFLRCGECGSAMAERWRSLSLPQEDANRRALEIKQGEIEAQLAELEEARFLRGEFNDADGIDRYTRSRSTLIQHYDATRDGLSRLRPQAALDIGVLLETELCGPTWEETPLQRKRDLLGLAIDRVYLWRGERAPGPRPQSSPLLPRLATIWAGGKDPYADEFGKQDQSEHEHAGSSRPQHTMSLE
jgi:site-specific DNA recombinase